MIALRARLVLRVVTLCVVLATGLRAAVFQSGSGRFEVSAWDADVAREVTGAAEEAWRTLAVPLALPEAFSSPVFLRVVRPNEWQERSSFLTQVEPGGVVSVRLVWAADAADRATDRAVVQGLLMRLAVAQHGVRDSLTVPLWLELGCKGWWRARAEGARLDSLKYETRRTPAARLVDLLKAQRGDALPREFELGAAWLVAVLWSESGRTAAWPQLLRRVLNGEPAATALDLTFGERFRGEADRELWWRTGLEQALRARTLPGLEADESRVALENLARLIVLGEDGDRAVPLAEMLAHAAEPYVAAEIARRSSEAARLAPSAHPFFRNAALSLVEALGSAAASTDRQLELTRAFANDWDTGVKLMRASAAALDAFEAAHR